MAGVRVADEGVALLLLLVWLVITTPLTSLVQGTEARITTYGINTEPPSPNTWLRKEVTLPEATSEVTVCFHLQLRFTYAANAMILTLGWDIGLIVSDSGYGMYLGKQYVKVLEEPRPWRWTHICVVVGPYPAIYLDSEYPPTQNFGDPSFYMLNMAEPVMVTLGMYGGVLVDTTAVLGGYFTLPQVFPGRLNQSQMETLAKCEEVSAEDLGQGAWQVMSTTGRQVGEINNNTSLLQYFSQHNTTVTDKVSVWEAWKEEVCLPRPPYRYVFLSGQFTYKAAVQVCRVYGGSLARYGDRYMEAALHRFLTEASHMTIIVWLLREETTNCTITINRLEYENPLVLEYLCDDDTKKSTHLACQMSWRSSLRLHHNGITQEDNTFYLVPREVTPEFFSLYGRRIVVGDGSSSSRLSLLDASNHTEAVTDGTDDDGHVFPIGRNQWMGVDNTISTMILTSCSLEEFTCNQGTCLPLEQRCDGLDDCGDDSDEICSFLLGPADSYRSHRPHAHPTTLNLTATLLRLVDVDVDRKVMKAWLMLTTRWQDSRVQLFQLSHKASDNTITSDWLWTPQYVLDNAVFQDIQNFHNKVNVFRLLRAHRNGTGQLDILEGYEGYRYRADRNAFIELKESFMVAYDCDFELSMYPFDVHECHMNISIKQTSAFKVLLSPQDIQVVSEAEELPMFSASRMCFRVPSLADLTHVSFRVLLYRRYGSYLLTTYSPCIVINIIGYFTLFFSADNFSDRTIVTLSCIIVIATIFSQVVVTIPDSATPKAIDVFFFYSIIRLFLIFLHHFLLFQVQSYVERRNRKNQQPKENTVQVLTVRSTSQMKSVSPADKDTPVPVTPWLTQTPPGHPLTTEDQADTHNDTHNNTPMPSYDRIFNKCSIGFGAVLDVLCVTAYSYVVFYYRNKVIGEFAKCETE